MKSQPLLIFLFMANLFSSSYFYTSQSPLNQLLRWSDPQYFYGYGPTTQVQLLEDLNKDRLDYINLFEILDLRTEINLEASTSSLPRYYIDGMIGIPFTEKLVMQNNYELDSYGSSDANWDGSKRELAGEWTGYLSHSSLIFDYGTGLLMLGRGNLFFQGYSQSLLLNGNTPPRTNLWWHHENRKWDFDWGVILLDDMNEKHRLFTFHRYSINSSKFSFGITEAIISQYDDFIPNGVKYLLPSSSLFEIEVNKSGGNLFWLIDAYYNNGKKHFFFEFLVDDFSIDGMSPHKLAYKIGTRYDANKLKLIAEYVNIDRWVGNYYYSELKMLENEIPIGHILGPDAHKISVDLISSFYQKLMLNLKLQLTQQGSGSIIEEWPVESQNHNLGYHSEKFPTGNNAWNFKCLGNIVYYVKDGISIRINMSKEETFTYSFNLNLLY